MLVDTFMEKLAIETAMEDNDGDYARLADRLAELNKALGEKKTHSADPLADKWEREIAEGKIPDFMEGM